ncbi:MAG: hypothetical protein NT166_15800 [Candidatus Aminicenantes bacterium]|nr:hypothetical protein [Candidatus Aminicenantes bacterium]
MIYIIVRDAVDVTGMIRRIAAAALPLIVLIFLIITVDAEDSSNLEKFILSIKGLFRFLIGIVIGADIIEAGRFFYKSDKETGISIYTIFLSSVLAFFLYMVMLGGLGSLQFSLFGMVLAGIVLIIFRGLPGSQDTDFSKVSIAIILLLNLMVGAIPLVKPDWAIASTPPIPEAVRPKKSGLNLLEKAYIDLLTSAVKSNENQVNSTDFLRGIKELKLMGSYHKIPVALFIDVLKKTYISANEYNSPYREIAMEAINFFVEVKATEACQLLSKIQTEGGYLYEPTKNATKHICGY